MPFQSQAQRRWMYATHPAMAKRWEALTPKGQQLPGHVSPDSTSEETNKPGVRKLPRPAGPKRDFAHLVPNQKARMRISEPSSEKEAMEENPVRAATGARSGKMSLAEEHPALHRRDILAAHRKKV